MMFSVYGCATQKGLIEKSGEWDRIAYSEYLVENCTWNVSAAQSKWQEIIFCDTLDGSLGWKWDFSGEKDTGNTPVIKSFPEVIFGRKPYDNYRSTTTRLPGELVSASFRLEYEYAADADGAYNTSTDISFTDSKNPSPANIRAKLMIWFDHRNMPFFESKTLKHAVIGGRAHDVFIDTEQVGPEGKWVYIALLPINLPGRGELNLNEYFNYALSMGALKPEWFLSSIEVGSEIASGKGEVVFKRFHVY
jgi:dihydrofolate reductase